jgi:hypothetical protein
LGYTLPEYCRVWHIRCSHGSQLLLCCASFFTSFLLPGIHILGFRPIFSGNETATSRLDQFLPSRIRPEIASDTIYILCCVS